MVTAAAALVYSHYDDISLADVKEIVLGSANSLDSLDGLIATGGMLDIGAALSYDLASLSNEQWSTTNSNPTSAIGTAPVITGQLVSQRDGTYLRLKVIDVDGDLTMLAYASGAWTAEDFASGRVGTSFSLAQNNEAVFSITNGGVFTFYACDAAGNSTVKTLTINNQITQQPMGYSQQPQQPQMQKRR